MTRVLATLVVALLALSPTSVSGAGRAAGDHGCCASPMATAPCHETVQALPCCGVPVPAPAGVSAGTVTLTAPRVTTLWSLGAERPPDSAALGTAAAANDRRLAATPPAPYLLHRVLRI